MQAGATGGSNLTVCCHVRRTVRTRAGLQCPLIAGRYRHVGLQQRFSAPFTYCCRASTEARQTSGSQPESDDSRSRRSLQVTFTCNRCGSRTQRLVNPHAWDKGLVYLQCQNCEVWHKLKDNQSMVEEIRLTDSG